MARVQYCEIRLTFPAEALEAVTHLLHKAGTGGVVIDDERAAQVRAYLPRDERLSARLAALRQELSDLVAFFPGMRAWQQQESFVDEEDWANAWRAHFHPLRFGRRLVVAPTWEPFDPQPGEVVLHLDPGMAFGTGAHASTALCLRAIEALVPEGGHVLDVGTGSGILGVAAVLLGAAQVTALDVDPLAVRIARQNAEINGVADRIQVHHGELAELLAQGLEPVPLALANLTRDQLVPLAPFLARALAPGGTVVASGIVAGGRGAVEAAFTAAGLRPVRTMREEDWFAIWARRAVPAA